MAEKRPSVGELLLVIATAVASLYVVVFTEFAKEWPTSAKLAGFVWVAVFLAMWPRYHSVLGGPAEEPGSDKRDDYEDLGESLLSGGWFNLAYVEWLSWALDEVDDFFGDAEPSGPSWLARSSGWQADSPTWTAASYDKCILLALLYPLATMLGVWVWSGHVGISEKALGLEEAGPGDSGLWRYGLVAGVVAEVFAMGRSLRGRSRKATIFWLAASVVVGLGPGAGAFAVAGVVMLFICGWPD